MYAYKKGLQMFDIKCIFLALSLLVLPVVSISEDTSSKPMIVKKSNIVSKTIGIKGMTCVGCEVTLEHAIKKIHGIVTVKASASDKNAVIAYDKTKTDEKTVTQIIKKMGYQPFSIVEK